MCVCVCVCVCVYSQAATCNDCGFLRTSMKLGIVLANGIMNICRNGAIVKSPYVSLGGHFTIWPLKVVSDLFRERQFCIVLQRNTFIGTQMIYS